AWRQRPPSEPGFDPPSGVGGEREREKGAREGEPTIAHHAREERVGGEARREKDDRAEQTVARLDRGPPEEQPAERGAEHREARRVELELRVAAPPVGVPVGGPQWRRQGA